MEDVPILGHHDENRFFKQVVGYYDAPAFARRARAVQDTFDQLAARCRKQRDEWLKPVRLRLGTLEALAGGWDVLLPYLSDAGQVEVLQELRAGLAPRLLDPPRATRSARLLRRALGELNEAIGEFNRRWREFVRDVDVTRVNELRDGYNRYYLVEKECAVRSVRLARQGFRRLEPVTAGELLGLFPELPAVGLLPG